jgi:hypothetical protein
MRKPAWLAEVIVQSIAVTVSILLALWVDQWKQRRAARDLATESMSNFVKEIRKNEARVDDILPYHQGISAMLAQVDSSHSIHTPAEFQSAIGIDGLKPPALLQTAWQTAVATGALTRLDYETVAALSQTYSMQDRFTEDSRVGFQSVTQASDFRRGDADLVVRRADSYLSEVVNTENDLRATYALTEEVLARKLKEMGAPATPVVSDTVNADPKLQPVPVSDP